jgi:nuclear pore complex protein Nup93
MSLPDFNKLFEQSRQLTAHIVAPDTMPQLERGLDQIDALTKKLSTKASRAGDPTLYASNTPGTTGSSVAGASGAVKGQIDARTAYLLANRGFDAEKVTATLNKINPAATFEPVEGLYDTDIEGYLRLEHETIVTSAIEENRAQTMKDCQDRFERSLHRDWEKAKKRIFEELGQHKQQAAGGRGTGFRSPQKCKSIKVVHFVTPSIIDIYVTHPYRRLFRGHARSFRSFNSWCRYDARRIGHQSVVNRPRYVLFQR